MTDIQRRYQIMFSDNPTIKEIQDRLAEAARVFGDWTKVQIFVYESDIDDPTEVEFLILDPNK